jgi:hypothetical protein
MFPELKILNKNIKPLSKNVYCFNNQNNSWQSFVKANNFESISSSVVKLEEEFTEDIIRKLL